MVFYAQFFFRNAYFLHNFDEKSGKCSGWFFFTSKKRVKKLQIKQFFADPEMCPCSRQGRAVNIFRKKMEKCLGYKF